MAFCPNCGTQSDGPFCPKCGASISATGRSPVSPVPPTLSIRLASALCYLFGLFTGILFLLWAPYNQDRTIRFHAFQSIFLNIALIVVQVGLSLVAGMFQMVSFTLALMVSSLHFFVSVGFFLLWLYMMWKTYHGEKVVLPIIGELAEKQVGETPSSSGTMGKAA